MSTELRFLYGHPTQFGDPFFRYLVSCDIKIDVVYARRPSAVQDDEIAGVPSWLKTAGDGYPHTFLEDTSFRSLRDVVKAPSKLLVLPGWGERWARSAFLAAVASRRRTLLHVDCSVGGEMQESARARLVRWFFLRSASNVGVVGSGARRYVEGYGVQANKIVVFPYPTDAATIASESIDAKRRASALRLDLGLSPGDVVLVAVTKLAQREDPLTLVEGFALASRKRPDLRLLLVGDGPLRTSVASRIEALGVGNKVVMYGYADYGSLPSLYAASNAFVHAARVEPWGVSVVEAMASGLPVVLADAVGASLDAVVPERGWTFPAGNAEMLAERLVTLGDRDDLASMGAVARRWAIDYCDYETIKNRLLRAASP